MAKNPKPIRPSWAKPVLGGAPVKPKFLGGGPATPSYFEPTSFRRFKKYPGVRTPGWISRMVKNWYGWAGTGVPEIGTPEYDKFIVGTAGMILRNIDYNREIADRVRVTFANQPTATMTTGYIPARDSRRDSEQGWIITLPSWCLTKEVYKKLMPGASDQEMADASVAVINGLLSHEALHVLLTKRSKKDILNGYDMDQLGNGFAMAVDVVEDLFIEDRATYWSGQFLQANGHMAVSDEKVMQAMAGFAMQPSLDTILPLLILLNVDSYEDAVWEMLPEDVKELLKKIPHCKDAYDRAHLAIQLYEMYPPAKTPKGASEDHSMWDGVDKTGLGDSECRSPSGNRLHEIEQGMVKEIEKMFSGWQGDKYVVYGSKEIGSVPPVIEQEVGDYEPGRASPMRIVNWLCQDDDLNFVRLLKALRTINHAPGPPEDKGPMLINTRLSRIVSDGKVFARQYDDARHQRVEVVLLVDVSGSTDHRTVETGKYGVVSLAQLMLSAAYRMFMSMREAGIACAAYVHTGVYMYHSKPLLVHVTSYDLPGSQIDPQRAFEMAYYVDRNENYDGFVLEKLSKAFSGKKSRKVIIHLSDGAPYGVSYGGDASRKHTQAMIGWLRSIGIDVFSMSVDRYVVETNNMLYGREYNLDASRDLEAQMKALIAKIM